MKDDYILIVDDELPIREMIHTSLDMAGFHCLQAEDARQAHQMIVDQRPALILLDWMMPGGVSGVDLCRRLKRDETLAEIPVIMLTARGEEDHKVQGLDAGADDYMTKPFSTRELVSRIKAVLRRSNALSGENSINDLQVYPNPTHGKVFVEADDLVSVVVYDVLGQEIMQSNATDNVATLNLSGLQSGVYFIKADALTGSSIQKIILN